MKDNQHSLKDPLNIFILSSPIKTLSMQHYGYHCTSIWEGLKSFILDMAAPITENLTGPNRSNFPQEDLESNWAYSIVRQSLRADNYCSFFFPSQFYYYTNTPMFIQHDSESLLQTTLFALTSHLTNQASIIRLNKQEFSLSQTLPLKKPFLIVGQKQEWVLGARGSIVC